MMAPLDAYVEHELARAVDEPVLAMARHILSLCRNVQSIFVYGSTLRGVAYSETLIDYYVTVSKTEDYAIGFFSKAFASVAPPNVYFAELEFGGQTLRAKYAVVPVGDLWHRVRPSHTNPYFWVRFCQPMRLVYVASESARQQANQVVIDACQTAYGYACGLLNSGSAEQKWTALFSETYFTELRPEHPDRASQIVSNQRTHFQSIAASLPKADPLRTNWGHERLRGKALTVLRLIKAATTFASGVDYVAWKIERHTGQKIPLTPWQRRHPILAGLLLLPSLLKKGVIR